MSSTVTIAGSPRGAWRCMEAVERLRAGAAVGDGSPATPQSTSGVDAAGQFYRITRGIRSFITEGAAASARAGTEYWPGMPVLLRRSSACAEDGAGEAVVIVRTRSSCGSVDVRTEGNAHALEECRFRDI